MAGKWGNGKECGVGVELGITNQGVGGVLSARRGVESWFKRGGRYCCVVVVRGVWGGLKYGGMKRRGDVGRSKKLIDHLQMLLQNVASVFS